MCVCVCVRARLERERNEVTANEQHGSLFKSLVEFYSYVCDVVHLIDRYVGDS